MAIADHEGHQAMVVLRPVSWSLSFAENEKEPTKDVWFRLAGLSLKSEWLKDKVVECR